MRALGDVRRKDPIEDKKVEAPKTEETPTPEPTQTDGFDESVTLG